MYYKLGWFDALHMDLRYTQAMPGLFLYNYITAHAHLLTDTAILYFSCSEETDSSYQYIHELVNKNLFKSKIHNTILVYLYIYFCLTSSIGFKLMYILEYTIYQM